MLTKAMKEYDFDKPKPLPNCPNNNLPLKWNRLVVVCGLNIQNHRLCNLEEVGQTFTSASYAGRVNRRKGHYNRDGYMLVLPEMTKHELMLMDMDALMHCIHQYKEDPEKPGNHNTIILHTNSLESKDWLDFLELCPYARKLYTVPSKMAQYDVTGWIISKKDYREVRPA